MRTRRTLLYVIIPLLLLALSCNKTFPENPAGSTERKFNRDEIRTLRYELNYKNMSGQRAAVVKGVLWLLDFVQDEKNFKFIFTNYIPMLYEISVINNDPVIQIVIRRLIRNESLRGLAYLTSIYDEDNIEDIILMIGILEQLNLPARKYIDHYNKNLAVFNGVKCREGFNRAAKALDYDKMTNGICDYSHFRFAFESGKNVPLRLPPDYRDEFLKTCAATPFVYTFRDESGFHDQNYYATHVVFFMTGYGRYRIKDTAYARRLNKYFLENFRFVRSETNDLDLLGEYVECMKIFGLGGKAEVIEALNYIVSQQNPDGSWVKEKGDDKDPYDLFHLSWTSITALYYNLDHVAK